MKNVLKLYLQYENKLFYILNMGTDLINYKSNRIPAIILDVYMNHFFKSLGVNHAHITYPATADVHQTFVFNDDKKMHVFREKISIQMPREIKNVKILTKKALNILTHMSPSYDSPSFDKFTLNTRIYLFTIAFSPKAIYHYPYIDVSNKPLKSSIFNIDGFSGTINISPFLSGSTEIEPVTNDSLSSFIKGDRPPFYGAIIKLISR